MASLYETACKNEDTIQNDLQSNIIQMDAKLDTLSNKLDIINLDHISKISTISDTTKELNDNKNKCHIIHKTLYDHILRLEKDLKKQNKNNFENLSWGQILKITLIKPWIWVFLSIVCFSPKGLEIIGKIIGLFG
jgi:hypothetical protein